MTHDTPRHKVFVAFHHKDQGYRDRFADMLDGYIVDRSVGDGDFDDQMPTATIRQNIRDQFIADATVTVVLVGRCTWQRKYVDWEIGSSLRATSHNPRCGLLGILLPTHPNYNGGKRNPRLIPPRLAENCSGEDPYARIYKWSKKPSLIQKRIHKAFLRRKRTPPNNNTQHYARNRSGDCGRGWQS